MKWMRNFRLPCGNEAKKIWLITCRAEKSCFHYKLFINKVSRGMNNFITRFILERIDFDAKLSAVEEKWQF